MSDDEQKIKEFTVYWADKRATAQFPEAGFGFRLNPDTRIVAIGNPDRLHFTTIEGADITVYTDKLLFTAERLVPEKPPTPPSASKPS